LASAGGGFFVKKSNVVELKGIVSASLIDMSTTVCDSSEFAIFTNVNHFTSWIEEKADEPWKYISMECDISKGHHL